MIVKMAQPPPFDTDQARTGKKWQIKHFGENLKNIKSLKYYLQLLILF